MQRLCGLLTSVRCGTDGWWEPNRVPRGLLAACKAAFVLSLIALSLCFSDRREDV